MSDVKSRKEVYFGIIHESKEVQRLLSFLEMGENKLFNVNEHDKINLSRKF